MPRTALPTQVASIEGTVLAIQGDELVLDLGSARGAVDGSSVELWRPVKLKHPVTGKVLTDRFLIGTLAIVQSRTTMALARANGLLARPAEVGDIVILASRVQIPPPGPEELAQPQGPAEPVQTAVSAPQDPEVKAVTEMFDALRGTPPWTRLRVYLEYVKAHPDGRFARVLTEEAAALRELLAVRVRRTVEEGRVEAKSFTRPADALAGEAFRLAVELNDAATGAVLHFRKKGAPTYTSLPMIAIGNGYFAATIPSAQMTAPAIEYFIEGSMRRGEAAAVVASASDPHRLDVFEAPRPPVPSTLPAKVEILTDYADYNRFRGNDRVWQTEGYFSIRRGDTGIRAVRSGFGVYRGVGGSVEDLDERKLSPRAVGLTYGYLETEIGVVRAFSFIGRMAVGLLDDGVSGGGQLMLRIGSDLKTNLVLGGELLGGVGLRGITQFELNTFERFPIMLRTEISNQPAGFGKSGGDPTISGGKGDLGGRGIVQVGFRIIPNLMIAVRGSFQGRNINHAGPGFGGAAGYSW